MNDQLALLIETIQGFIHYSKHSNDLAVFGALFNESNGLIRQYLIT